MTDLVMRAAAFAAKAHEEAGQTRKYTGEPYIVHPSRVAGIVSSVTSSEVMIAAAWLHDTVEDASVSPLKIECLFGHEVARIVESLTKVADGEKIGREEAARRNIEHASHGSPAAKTVKLADLIDNISDIVEHDPEFARIYIPEKKMLMEHLGEGNPVLYRRASKLIDELLEQLASNMDPVEKQ